MNAGFEQEKRLVPYLRQLGYRDVVPGENDIKRLLDLPFSCKCADVLAFSPTRELWNQIVVAESKGTDVVSSLTQLGNTAAGVLEKFGATKEKFDVSKDLKLLLYRSELRELAAGLSPGPGYLVKATNDPKVYELLQATSETISLARAKCELDPPWSKCNAHLKKLVIKVYVE
jgi:hypothetical protein